MKHRLLFRILPLTLIGITSCALPPREAWRVIQREGLIPYIAVEIGKKPVPSYVVRVTHPPRLRPLYVPSPKPMGTMAVLTPSQTAPRVTAPALASTQQVRPSLPSARYFDTSPISTTPPAHSLDKPVSLAETQPKLNQNAVRSYPPIVTKSTSLAPSPQRQKLSIPTSNSVENKGASEEMRKTRVEATAVNSPKPELKNTPPVAGTPKLSTASEPKVSPKPIDLSTPPPPIVKANENSVVSTPYGVPVPGRPGLVSSPYAGQYQLVDVTGLSAGQEVKCPYSGKIFKVPAAQIQAINKVPELSAPPAPADKKP